MDIDELNSDNDSDDDSDGNYFDDEINAETEYKKEKGVSKGYLIQKFPKYRIWLEELINMEQRPDWIISYTENNIFEVSFTLFYQDQVRASFVWNIDPEKYYPNYPPKMQWISPKLEWKKLTSLLHFSLFDPENWNICQSLITILDKLKEFILNSKIISEDLEVSDFENLLIELNNLSNIWPNNFSSDLPDFGIIKDHQISVKRGTGYSKGNIVELDLSEHNKKIQRIEKIYQKVSKSLTNQDPENYLELILYSSIIPYMNILLDEVSIQEMFKNRELYRVLFQITSDLYHHTDETIPKDLPIYARLKKIGNKMNAININSRQHLSEFEKEIIQLSENLDITVDEEYSVESDIFLNFLKERQLVISDKMSSNYFVGNRYCKVTNPKVIKRLFAEWIDLQDTLPLGHEGSIFINWPNETEFPNLFKILIIPSTDTPYAFGCFVFDMIIPNDYPNESPKVQYLTTGGGTARFNPNLYACGKVCLSLLGTWAGERWNPNMSNIYQLFVSILGLIFVKNPFFNEPAYTDREIEYAAQSEDYNQTIRSYTVRYAIKEMIKNPVPEFKEIIQFHFKNKIGLLTTKIEEWVDLEPLGSRKKNQMISDLEEIKSYFIL